MAFRTGLYDRLIYDDEVSALVGLADQHRAMLVAPTTQQRREQFIDELLQSLPELLDVAAAGGADAGEKARLKGELLAAGALLGVLQQNPADWFADQTKAVDGAQIEALIADRNAARKARDFKEADRLRTAIAAIGVVIEDRPDGTTKWRMAE